jgi:hypothetical protein
VALNYTHIRGSAIDANHVSYDATKRKCWHCSAASLLPQVLGPRRRTVVNYKEKGYSRFDSDDSDSEGAAGRRRKRAAAEEADDFAPDAAAAEGDGQDDNMLPHKKKHKKREVRWAAAAWGRQCWQLCNIFPAGQIAPGCSSPPKRSCITACMFTVAGNSCECRAAVHAAHLLRLRCMLWCAAAGC